MDDGQPGDGGGTGRRGDDGLAHGAEPGPQRDQRAAWNRSRDKAEPLAKDGVQVCDSPADGAAGASVILTMLADTDAVTGVVEGERGAFSALPPATGSGTVDGLIWLQMSTIGRGRHGALRGPGRAA